MWPKSKPYLMVLPAVAMLLLLGAGGFVQALLMSLRNSSDEMPLGGYLQGLGLDGLSLDAYRELFEDRSFWLGLGVSLKLSLLSTLASALLGMLLAIGLFWWGQRQHSTRRSRIFSVSLIPLAVPHLAAAYAMFLLLTQSGWLSRGAYHFGLIRQMSDFPVLVNEPMGVAIVLTYLWKETPFFVLLLYPVLSRVHGEWYAVARMNGAGRWRYLFYVLIPLCWPAWLAASLIVFAFAFTAYEIPYLLGVTEPKWISVFAVEMYTGEWGERPKALAAGMILFAIISLISALMYGVSRRWLAVAERGWL